MRKVGGSIRDPSQRDPALQAGCTRSGRRTRHLANPDWQHLQVGPEKTPAGPLEGCCLVGMLSVLVTVSLNRKGRVQCSTPHSPCTTDGHDGKILDHTPHCPALLSTILLHLSGPSPYLYDSAKGRQTPLSTFPSSICLRRWKETCLDPSSQREASNKSHKSCRGTRNNQLLFLVEMAKLQ